MKKLCISFLVLYFVLMMGCVYKENNSYSSSDSLNIASSGRPMVDSSSDYSSSYNSYTSKRTVDIYAKNGTTVKVGDVVAINVYHSPTQMSGVEVDYMISNCDVAQFAYDEDKQAYEKSPSGCVIEAIAAGEFQVTVSVKSNEGNCSDSLTVVVVE